MIYVTSDLHGAYDAFISMLKIINFSENDYLYIIGDVLDRGEYPIKLLKYIMKQPNMQLIRGNHDQALLWNCHDNDSPWPDQDLRRFWLEHGGQTTLKEFEILTEVEQQEVVAYLQKTPFYMILEDYILVHAAIRTDQPYQTYEELMARQKEFDMLWEKDEFLMNPISLKDKTLIFGHTCTLMIRQLLNEPLDSVEMWKDHGRIGIDCGYHYGGRMAFLNLDNLEEFYLSPNNQVTIRDKNGRLVETYSIRK